MSDESAIRTAIEVLQGLLDGKPDDGSNDWRTAPLDGRGVWRPAWLKPVNERVLKRHPGFYIDGPSVDWQGRPITRTPYRLIDGFVFQPIAGREDLTLKQRAFYHDQHNYTFLGASTGDFGNVLAYLPLDADGSEEDRRGYFTASLHYIHQNAADLPRLVEKLYRTHGLLPALEE